MDWLRAGTARQEFERFVVDRTGPLLRTAYLMAGDLAEAEDLVQEALLRVARHWPRVRVMEYQAAYARRVLINIALDGATQRARRTGELVAADSTGTWEPTDIRAQRDLLGVDDQPAGHQSTVQASPSDRFGWLAERTPRGRRACCRRHRREPGLPVICVYRHVQGGLRDPPGRVRAGKRH
jgi:DNA-directed RNA polymerase specialized sigma24 family protein